MNDPRGAAFSAATELAYATGVLQHDVAVVLGSGWAPTADLLGETVCEIDATSLTGFAPPVVDGHVGRIRSVRNGNKSVLVFMGRTHLYEGRGIDPVVHAVRTAAASGVASVILTNSSGGLNPMWSPGTPVLISDHINLTGVTPVVGAKFFDMSDVYSSRLRHLARSIDPTLAEGVFTQVRGPQYETPAEIRMIRAIGGDLVGMSTALEAIAAREAGLEVMGMSLVTNFAAGMTDAPLNHEEVLAAGQQSAIRMGSLLSTVVAQM